MAAKKLLAKTKLNQTTINKHQALKYLFIDKQTPQPVEGAQGKDKIFFTSQI